MTPAYLGVDIGTTSIKIVEVERGTDRPRLVNYGFLESQGSLARANTAFQTSSLKLFDQEIAELLKLALAKMRPKASVAVASLPGFVAFMTVLKFPLLSAQELSKTITFQARQYVPLPLEEVALDWLKVGEYTDDRGTRYQQVLLISVPQEQVKKYQRIFRSAGLSLAALEIEGLSLARSLVGSDPTPTCIVDIGSRSTALAIVDGGELKFASQSDFAGATLTQAIAASLNINPVRAEELKRERGIVGTGPNYELSTIMLPFLDGILSEVKRAQFSYESQFPQAAKIERVILSGGGANLLGIEKYASRELGIPAVKAAPFLKFEYPPAIEPVVRELGPMMSVALGLALRTPSS
jgi:type IV pilus assembly protein PilM